MKLEKKESEKEELGRRLYRHHPVRELATADVFLLEDLYSFGCSRCILFFEHPDALERHVRQRHGVEGESDLASNCDRLLCRSCHEVPDPFDPAPCRPPAVGRWVSIAQLAGERRRTENFFKSG